MLENYYSLPGFLTGSDGEYGHFLIPHYLFINPLLHTCYSKLLIMWSRERREYSSAYLYTRMHSQIHIGM